MDPTTPQAPQAPQQTNSLAAWPGAFKLYNTSKTATLVNWQTFLLLLLVSFAGSFVFDAIGGDDSSEPIYFISQLLSFVLSVFLGAATTVVLLKNTAREKISIGQSLSVGSSRFVPILLTMVFVGLAVGFSALLFIIPFFFIMPRLILAPYYVIDKNMGPIDAIKASWEDSRGHAGKVWGVIGVSLLFALIMITIIGIPVALYLLFMYSTAPALLYAWITGASARAPAAPVAPVAPTAPAAPQQ